MLNVKNKVQRIIEALAYLHSYAKDAIFNITCREILKRDTNNKIRFRSINMLFPVKNSVLAVYFQNDGNKKSAFFFEYDVKSDSYIVHYAKCLYSANKKNMPRRFIIGNKKYLNEIENDIFSIFSEVSSDVQNIYRVMFLNKLPVYFPTTIPTYSVNIDELPKTEVEKYKPAIQFRLNANLAAKKRYRSANYNNF